MATSKDMAYHYSHIKGNSVLKACWRESEREREREREGGRHALGILVYWENTEYVYNSTMCIVLYSSRIFLLLNVILDMHVHTV